MSLHRLFRFCFNKKDCLTVLNQDIIDPNSNVVIEFWTMVHFSPGVKSKDRETIKGEIGGHI